MLKRVASLALCLVAFVLLSGSAPANASSPVRGTGTGKYVASAETSTNARVGNATGRTAARAAAREAARRAWLAHLAQLRENHEALVQRLPECSRSSTTAPEAWCEWQPPGTTGSTSRPSRAAVEAYVRVVTASIQLPEAYPQIGPDPAWNEWNMAVIGIPLWLWVEGPDQVADSVSEEGLSVSLTARHSKTTFAGRRGRHHLAHFGDLIRRLSAPHRRNRVVTHHRYAPT